MERRAGQSRFVRLAQASVGVQIRVPMVARASEWLPVGASAEALAREPAVQSRGLGLGLEQMQAPDPDPE